MQYLWLVLLLLSVILEILFVKGFFLCFIPSALVAMVLAFCSVEIYIQVAVFAALVILCFIFLRPLVGKKGKAGEGTAFSVEEAIGTRCAVVERLDNLAGRGAVVVGGMEWAARTTSDDIVIETGSMVEIIAVEGVKFICRAVD